MSRLSDPALQVQSLASCLPAASAAAVRALLAEHRAALELIKFQEHTIANLAMSDELTGLNNRRSFLLLAEQHVRGADRARNPLVLFFADVDGLKRINDTLGHAAGDEAIRCVARALEASFRSTDVIARLGGDEFVVLAPECKPDSADALMERVHATLASLPGRPCALAMSMGYIVYERRGDDAPSSIDELLTRADAAMYARKRAKKRAA